MRAKVSYRKPRIFDKILQKIEKKTLHNVKKQKLIPTKNKIIFRKTKNFENLR